MSKTKSIIGKIIGVHGIKGEIKVYPLLDDLSAIEAVEHLIIAQNTYTVESSRSHKNIILFKLKEIKDRNGAEKLSGMVEAEIELRLNPGEYLIQDLIGMKVLDAENQEVGKVKNISQSPQTLLFVELNPIFAAKSDLLVPFVEDYILEVAIDTGFIKINLAEDLLDLVK